jgi:hypothetical protein
MVRMSGTYTTPVSTSPFDIAGIQHSIDATMATLPANERGNLILSAKRGDGVKAALVVRGPDIGPLHSEVIGWATLPLAGKAFDWGGQARVSWLIQNTSLPKPALFARVRGWYRVLRMYNTGPEAAAKALLAWLGFDVRVAGQSWYEAGLL